MTAGPISGNPDMQAVDCLSILQHHEITILPIVDTVNKLIGIVHLHDLLGKGEFRLLV